MTTLSPGGILEPSPANEQAVVAETFPDTESANVSTSPAWSSTGLPPDTCSGLAPLPTYASNFPNPMARMFPGLNATVHPERTGQDVSDGGQVFDSEAPTSDSPETDE